MAVIWAMVNKVARKTDKQERKMAETQIGSAMGLADRALVCMIQG